ncbi:MAG: hypothetical protein QM569_15320 [Acidovorax sp.]|uniref:hypothetical protein n=1 Tax=Acidovorax sp. TaxID=1872122 RepID=UPI0039E215EA
MKTTMNLLENALKNQPAPYWTQRLNLARTTLATAKVRGHLSPAIAGALAEEMGEDAKEWIVVAALESERDSACKTRMVRKILGRAALACVYGLAVAATVLIAPSQAMAHHTEAFLYIMYNLS